MPTNHAIKDLLLVMCYSRFDESKLHCNTAFRAKQLREVEGISFFSDKQNESLRLVSEPRPTVSNCQEGCRALDRDVDRFCKLR